MAQIAKQQNNSVAWGIMGHLMLKLYITPERTEHNA